MRCVPSSRMSFPDLSVTESLDAASIKLSASQQRLCQNRALPQSPSLPGWARRHEQTHPAHRWLLKPPKHDWHSEGGRELAACSLMFRLGEPIVTEHQVRPLPGGPWPAAHWLSDSVPAAALWDSGVWSVKWGWGKWRPWIFEWMKYHHIKEIISEL